MIRSNVPKKLGWFARTKHNVQSWFEREKIVGSVEPTIGSFKAGLIRRFADEAACPCCPAVNEFMTGPQGGMSMNIMCSGCGSRFNWTGIGTLHLLEWTHGPQPAIWNGKKQKYFPDEEHVQKVREALKR